MLLLCSFISALEAGPGSSEGLLGGMSIPVGMTRRALSYDDNLERPMSPPPTDININNLWRRPVIPERKFARLAEVCVHCLFFDRFARRNMQIEGHSKPFGCIMSIHVYLNFNLPCLDWETIKYNSIQSHCCVFWCWSVLLTLCFCFNYILISSVHFYNLFYSSFNENISLI